MKYKDFFKEDMIPGGKGDNTPIQSIDPKQLAMGIKVEMEHTNDERLAKEIASDHIQEDPAYYTKLQQAGLADELEDNKGVRDINTDIVQKQTTPETVYEPVKSTKPTNVCGCIGNTIKSISNEKSNVDSNPEDPSPTDHVTGGMEGAKSNPNILPKDGCEMVKSIGGMISNIMPQDIEIDIAESRKIINRLKKNLLESKVENEGYGGTPGNDPKYLKGKRWTVKWYENSSLGDFQKETIKKAVETVVMHSDNKNKQGGIDSIIAYLNDQGISNIDPDMIENLYDEMILKK